MKIKTTRFGEVEIDESRITTFPKGIVGFPIYKRFALIQTNDDGVFYWLQSVDAPELAFIVCDPHIFVPDYRVPLRREDIETIELADASSIQVLVIVNKVGDLLTGNLQGPLVVNTAKLIGIQLVLSDKRYTTRYPLLRLAKRENAMASTA